MQIYNHLAEGQQMRLPIQYYTICLFQLGELALGLKFSSQRGHTLEVIIVCMRGIWLTFLRLKALSSSFSTAWIFLTLMMQRASFPGKQESFCQMCVKNNNTLQQSEELRVLRVKTWF